MTTSTTQSLSSMRPSEPALSPATDAAAAATDAPLGGPQPITPPASPLSIEEASARILSVITPVGSERVFLDQACGRVLSEPIASATDWPRFDQAAMDGFAARAGDLTDTQRTLQVIGARFAGDGRFVRVGEGQAVVITTGALLPDGADTIIANEHAQILDDTRVQVTGDLPKPNQHIRRRGSDFLEHAPLASPGQLVDPGFIGLLAATGRLQAQVYRRPRVAIVSSGDELVEIDAPRAPWQLVNSSPLMIRALVAAAGCEPLLMRHAPDKVSALRDAMQEASRCADIIVSIGGVAVGDRDLMREAVGRYPGSAVGFWRVDMKPGKPLAFGHFLGRPWIGLPGNPVASATTAWLFLLPALMKARGLPAPWVLPCVPAKLSVALHARTNCPEIVRGKLSLGADGVTFYPHPSQAPGDLRSAANTDALFILQPRTQHTAGATGRVLLVASPLR